MSGKKIFLYVCFLAFVVIGPANAAPGVEVRDDLTLGGNGGIVFPDGTTQTTASRPTWGQKIPGVARWQLVLGGEAVLDKETGLVWQRQADGVERTYSQALDYCTFGGLAGRRGLRLPTIEELSTLIDYSIPGQGLPSDHLFIGNSITSYYWSSTTHSGDPQCTDCAWVVLFANGNLFYNNKSSISTDYGPFVRCVRG
ncbi:MAG: hypothetical protein C0402_11500 [Thermodesulfovibrio sp.]|nr:hypothetical protein [Thermodesulfovibrio sp.]